MNKIKKNKVKKSASGDMTQGNPWKKLILFAIPILLSSLLQQLYNAVDSIIVGHAVGPTALGAVGVTGSTIQLFIALFMGLSSGACVVVARYFGKKDYENLNKTVHTAMIVGVIAGFIISVIGIIFSPLLIELINTPAAMVEDATTYLQIFFGGVIALAIYNMGASIFQAVGNSRITLYFLLATTILNIFGDLLLTVVFEMGVAGAAIATVISEIVSALLVLLVLSRTKREYKLSFKKLKIDKKIMKQIISIGLPGAIQQSIVSISNITVQSYINGLGDVAVSGHSATNRLDAFLPLPIGAMGLALTPYVSQNLGAGEEKRARKGVWIACIVGISATATLCALALIFNRAVLSMFTSDPAVLDNGLKFSRVIIPFYFILAGTQILPGALRGAGKVKFATISSIISFVVIRQIYLLSIKLTVGHTIATVAVCYPMTWAISAGAILIYYLSKKHISADGLMRVHTVHTDGTNADFLGLCKKLDEYQNANVPGREEAGLNSLYNSENLKDIFLLYDGKDVIGSAGLWRHDDETCEIVRSFVDTRYQKKGYEKMLMTEVESLAKGLGFKHIHLRTFNTIASDLETFKEFGFSDISADDFKYVDKYPQARLLASSRVYMKRDLN